MIVTPLLKLASDRKASDLFFSVGAPVNIKIDGVTVPVNAQLMNAETIKRIAYELMSSRQIIEFEASMEMNFSYRVEGLGSFRVNVFRQRGDVAVVIRHIRSKINTVDDLRLPSVLKKLIMENTALIYEFISDPMESLLILE